MATWPATLPDLSLDGYSVTLIDPVIRTDMDAGNTRMRRRFSRAQDKITARWLMNKTQVDTFEGFHRSTIQNGAQPFTLSIRVGASATNVTARFLDPYTVKLVAPNWWEVTGSLLIDDRDGYGTAPVPTTPPQNTVAPVISGTTTQGLTLSTNLGTWTGTQPISYGYQWKRSGSNISNATSSTYTLVQADIGSTITCQIAAQNVAGSNTSTTAAVGPVVAASAPANTGTPAISGTAKEGQVLTIHVGTWSGTVPITYTYQWKRGGVDISNAESVTYLLVTADVGTNITCNVTATNLVGSASQLSNSVGPIATITTAPSNTSVPVISGTTTQGETLSATTGVWTGTEPITYSYTWKRNTVAIQFATLSTYTLVLADVGQTITCTVTATNATGSSTATSASAGTIQGLVVPSNTVAPTISGTATEGQTLSCTTGTWTGTTPISYSYQWKRNTVAITNATASTYVLVTADVLTTITCTVTGTNLAGNASVTTSGVGPVAALVDQRPRWGLYAAGPFSTNSEKQAILAACTTKFGDQVSDNGTFYMITTTGNYGWVAVRESVIDPPGFAMVDSTGADVSVDFDGAGNSGPGSQGADTMAQVHYLNVTDANSVIWRLYRTNYVNSMPSSAFPSGYQVTTS